MPSEMVNGQAPKRPTMRSPGLPGTDVRGASFVPPISAWHGRRSDASGPYKGGFNDPTNLKSLPGRAMTAPMSSAPFHGASRNGRFVQTRALNTNVAPGSAPGSTATTPTLPPTRHPSIPTNPYATTNGSTLTDAMKRTIHKKDISEPTFVMSTSRVPTKNLPHDGRGRGSRNGSISEPSSPPPLPPVNPRRRRDSSKTRTLMNGIPGERRGDEMDPAAFSRSTPQLPLPSPAVPAFSNVADEESGRRLRKANSELGMDMRAGVDPKRISPPQVAIGPPANRAAVGRGGPSPNMNGGMF